MTWCAALAAGASFMPDSGSERPHILYADGASRGNPGPAAIGFVLRAGDGQVISEGGELIGRATNNEAEYRALIRGLQTAQGLGVRRLQVRLDSELVVRQLSGRYRVKSPGLRPLHQRVMELTTSFASFEVAHIPRESNRRADTLASRALDATTPHP